MKKYLNLIVLLFISSFAFSQGVDRLDAFCGDWKSTSGNYFAQVYKDKNNAYKINIVDDLTTRGKPIAELAGVKASEFELTISGRNWSGKISKKDMSLKSGNQSFALKPIMRTSPTMGAKAPKDAIVLFNGKNMDAWTRVAEKDWLEGGAPADNWKILPGGILEVVPNSGSIITKQKFGDLEMHLEFRLLGDVTNGGVYLMSRYELNIKDAYGTVGGTPIGFGNVSDPKDLYPSFNMAFPPMQWQTFDIDFRAPRFDATGTKKIENARITLVHNGVTIYDDVEIVSVKGSTAKLGEAGVGPVYLQDHGTAYQFRNIWVIDKTLKGTENFQTVEAKSGQDDDSETVSPTKKGGNKAGGKKGGGRKNAGTTVGADVALKNGSKKTSVNNNSADQKSGKKKGSSNKRYDASYEGELNPFYADKSVNTTYIFSDKPAPASEFVHPGILINSGQLEEIRNRVNNGIEPQKTAFMALKDSRYGALDYMPTAYDTVSCGPYSNPDIGCKDEQSDVIAAYSQALLWVITRNKTYAENAIRIMNEWSYTLNGGHNYANGPVQAAWCGSVWPRAAEIIRYTYDGWKESDIARFQNMLRTQYLPSIIHGNCENGNKELAMSEALINIGVFNDDREVFDLGVKMWRGRTPAYIYLKSDGPTPIEPPGCGMAIWGNKGYTPEFVDGLLQETARDTHHAWMAFASMVNAAETAYIQGVDLYGEEGERIMAAMEFQGQYLKPNNRPWPEHLEFALNPTWEIAYNHFHNRKGNNLPKIGAVIPTNRSTGTNHHIIWETLTHGEMGN